MIFMFNNQLKLFIYKKQIFEIIIAEDVEIIKDIYIIQPIFSFTNVFDCSGDRVMKFTASGHRSVLIVVRGKCKYMH